MIPPRDAAFLANLASNCRWKLPAMCGCTWTLDRATVVAGSANRYGGGGWAVDDRCSPNKMQPLAQADSLTFPVSRCCLRDQLQAFVEPSRQRAVISQGLICADVPKADVKLHVASVAQGVYKP